MKEIIVCLAMIQFLFFIPMFIGLLLVEEHINTPLDGMASLGAYVAIGSMMLFLLVEGFYLIFVCHRLKTKEQLIARIENHNPQYYKQTIDHFVV